MGCSAVERGSSAPLSPPSAPLPHCVALVVPSCAVHVVEALMLPSAPRCCPACAQALVASLESRSMSDREKVTLVDVMAPFNYLTCRQIAQVVRCFSMGDELVGGAGVRTPLGAAWSVPTHAGQSRTRTSHAPHLWISC
jgi:hypothetical protein